MAAPPKCKVCGTAHWTSQPHAFSAPNSAAKVETVKAMGPKIVIDPPAQISVSADPVVRLAELEAKEAGRKAKLAAYMRGYRARAYGRDRQN